MFKSQRHKRSDARVFSPDAFATAAVEVLPGLPLARSAVATLPEPEPAAPEPAPEPQPVAIPPHMAASAQPVAVAVAPAPVTVPAGWYPDPAPGGTGRRYWDGVTWTNHLTP